MTRRIALLLTLATGFAGLVYEVTWQRYLATLLGSHSEATAAVLGIFLGGLAGGYAVFGRVARRITAEAGPDAPRRLLRLYGAVELAIGAYALVFPWLFTAALALAGTLPELGVGADFAVDVALAALLIGPPTLLMGSTIPMLTQALPRGLEDATRVHAIVYALNTAGAFAGALAAGFVLVPRLGLVGVLLATGTLSVLAGALYLVIAGRAEPSRATAPPAAGGESGPALRHLGAWALAAALLGFAMMAVQTVLIRLGGLSFGSSEYTFTIVVAVFVLCIALGSFAVSFLPRASRAWVLADLWGLALLLGLLYPRLEEAPYWVHWLRTQFGSSDADFVPFQLASFAGLLATLGPAVALSGASLPLIFHQLRREVGDLGTVAGRLYGWNTLGSLVGALTGGYVLLFWLDLHHVYRIAVAAVVGAAAIATWRLVKGARLVAPVVALAGLGVLVALPAWRGEYLSMGAFRIRQPIEATSRGPGALVAELWQWRTIRFYDDDPTLTAVVAESSGEEERSLSILTNGKSDGNTVGDYRTMSMIALVPALLAERVESAFVIGFGTGITAGELASLPSVREVVVAEISSGVIEAAPLFDAANLGVSRDPKIRTLRSDAYRALLRSETHYDLILSEPSNPWTAGVEMLFSREYLEAARSRLAPGGVYGQWMHQYETSRETLELVLRTFAAVFPHVSIWYTNTYDLMILGFAEDNGDPALHLDRMLERVQEPGYRRVFERARLPSLVALLGHELVPVGALHASPLPGPLHTLLHPRLGHVAGRAFFRGLAARLPFTGAGPAAELGSENSLLRGLWRRHGVAPEERWPGLAREACRNRTPLCTVWLAQWRLRFGETPAWQSALEAARQPRVVFGAPVDPERVRRLASLYPRTPLPAVVTPAWAAQASADFRRFHHHAFPFDPHRLVEIWRRCRAPASAPDRCLRGLEEARALVGPLAAAPTPRAGRAAGRGVPATLGPRAEEAP